MPDSTESNSNSDQNPTPSQKPLNPQMENVLANQPKSQPQLQPDVRPSPTPAAAATVSATGQKTEVSRSSVAGAKGMMPSTKIGTEKSTASRRRFLIGCFGGFIFLFLLFIILMVVMISRSGGNSAVINAFGLDATGVRSFLQGTVGFTFGLFSLFFLILAVIGLFRFLGTQKSDKEKRQHNVRLSLFSTISLVVLIFIWVFLANFITRMTINIVSVSAEIQVLSPTDLTKLEAPIEIRFSAENVAKALQQSGLTIQAMAWDLDGDGTFETPVREAEITRIYNQRGSYNVALQVQIAGEDTPRVYTKPIFIETAIFDASPDTGSPPLAVQFDASNIVSSDNIQSLDWDFDGDGQFDIEGPDNMKPRYTFDKIGTYNVLLRAIDKNGSLERYTRKIEVTASSTPLLSARIQASPGLTGTAPFQVRFDAGDSTSLKGKITSYQWDFGDGSDLELGKSVSHVFDQAKTFKVTLVIKDDLGNQAQTTVEIQAGGLSSAPQPVIRTTPSLSGDETSLSGKIPFAVTFDAAGSTDPDDDIVEYAWDFDGDGKVDTVGTKANHTFDKAGTYTVNLFLTDSQDNKVTSSLTVVVQEPGATVVIKAIPLEGPAPLVVQFDGSASTAFKGNIVSYEWDFGDGSPKTMTAANVSHKYDKVGAYEVRLRIATDMNESATGSAQIFVRELPLEACFEPSRTSGKAPLIVSYNSQCTQGKVKAYEWDYGDGSKSSSASPTHTFDQPGTYKVTLQVTDDKNNVDSFDQMIVAE